MEKSNLFYMNINCWGTDEWAVLGQWAGAIASFSAVVISLILARRSYKPKVKINARVSVDDNLIHNPKSVIEEMIITVSVTNIGMIPIVVTNTSVRFPSILRWNFFRSPHIRYGDAEKILKKKIETSETISYFIKEIDLARALKQLGFLKGKIAVKIYCVDSLKNNYKTKYKVNLKKWESYFKEQENINLRS